MQNKESEPLVMHANLDGWNLKTFSIQITAISLVLVRVLKV